MSPTAIPDALIIGGAVAAMGLFGALESAVQAWRKRRRLERRLRGLR